MFLPADKHFLALPVGTSNYGGATMPLAVQVAISTLRRFGFRTVGNGVDALMSSRTSCMLLRKNHDGMRTFKLMGG